MAVKAAKDRFSKREIIDILKQNVTLFKNEPEFVEYIVNLALYLIDQAYTVSGERSADLESIISQFESIRREAGEGGTAAPESRSLRISEPTDPLELESKDDFLPDEDDLDDGAPTTNKMKLQKYDAVMKSPPPPEPPEDDEPPTLPTLKLASPPPQQAEDEDAPAAKAESDDSEMEDLSSHDEEPRTRQLRSVGILTPDADGGLIKDRGKKPSSDASPKIEVGEDKGRARVYRVVRSYSASKGGDSNCPICGTDTKGASRCPSCGHIM